MKNILVIRRDNIGDLVCTTPLFAQLRSTYPSAFIAAMVNSYNAAVLAGNPDIDETYVYTKAKHRAHGESVWHVWWRTLTLLRRIRATEWDAVFLASTAGTRHGMKFVRRLSAKRVVGFGQPADGLTDQIQTDPSEHAHECELVMRLLQPFGIHVSPGAVRVFPDGEIVARYARALPHPARPVIGVHISARKAPQRWPVEYFARLVRLLRDDLNPELLLFWSPGAKNDRMHPGDDDRARILLDSCRGLPIRAMPTVRLDELVAGLSLCDHVICSDGGAMHLAAGLGKPMICFFGNSSPARWHPWGVPHKVLRPASENVRDISPEEAKAEYLRLLKELGPTAGP